MMFHTLLNALRSARDPYGKGKPRENNTWLHLVGSFDQPERIDVRFHSTRICRFYPDGSREVHHGWTTMTTLARIRDYAQVQVQLRELASVNGYRPRTERAHFIGVRPYGYTKWVPFNAVDTYIRITPDNEFDMSTVKPWDTYCITHPKELRRTMNHLLKCAALLLGYAKLADNDHCFENGSIHISDWFMRHMDVPLPDVKLDPRPMVFVPINGSLKSELRKARKAIRWTIADRNKWIGPCKIMECRNG